MRAGRDLARHGVIGIDLERGRTLHVLAQRITMGQHKARHAIGERGLADALRAADQPGMCDASAAVGVEQRRFRLMMPEQRGGLARMRHRSLGFGLARTHAGLGTPALTKKRSRKVLQILVATVSTSALASMTTQRCGSALAISA